MPHILDSDRYPDGAGGINQRAYIAGGVYDANGKKITKVVYEQDPGSLPHWTPMISQAFPWVRFCVLTAAQSACGLVP